MSSDPQPPPGATSSDGKVNWENLWINGVKPGEYFDKSKPLPELTHEVQSLKLKKGKVALVPGCGRGYDVELLSRSGIYEKIYGMDISSTGVNIANEYLSNLNPPLPNNYEILKGDFFNDHFNLNDRVDFIYDYTFFCAIPLEMRQNWANRMKQLIKKGGILITVMFPYQVKEDGPPFGVSKEAYEKVLGEDFIQKDGPRYLNDDQVNEGRQGRTWWCKWERV